MAHRKQKGIELVKILCFADDLLSISPSWCEIMMRNVASDYSNEWPVMTYNYHAKMMKRSREHAVDEISTMAALVDAYELKLYCCYRKAATAREAIYRNEDSFQISKRAPIIFSLLWNEWRIFVGRVRRSNSAIGDGSSSKYRELVFNNRNEQFHETSHAIQERRCRIRNAHGSWPHLMAEWRTSKADAFPVCLLSYKYHDYRASPHVS